MNIPESLRYTKEHEWVSVNGDIATVGITDFAQGELGDVVFVDLPSEGDAVNSGSSFGTIEAVKAVSDLYAPLDGEVVEINSNIDSDPSIVNSDPYGNGWMIKIKLSDSSQLDDLLSATDYNSLIS